MRSAVVKISSPSLCGEMSSDSSQPQWRDQTAGHGWRVVDCSPAWTLLDLTCSNDSPRQIWRCKYMFGLSNLPTTNWEGCQPGWVLQCWLTLTHESIILSVWPCLSLSVHTPVQTEWDKDSGNVGPEEEAGRCQLWPLYICTVTHCGPAHRPG